MQAGDDGPVAFVEGGLHLVTEFFLLQAAGEDVVRAKFVQRFPGFCRQAGEGIAALAADAQDFDRPAFGERFDAGRQVGQVVVFSDGDFEPGRAFARALGGGGSDGAGQRFKIAADGDHGLEARHGQGADGLEAVAVEIDEQHFLGLLGFVEAERDGRAAIADMFQSADFLRPVDVAERDVVGRRKGSGGEGFEGADVDFTDRFAGAGADRGQVAGGDDGQRAAEIRAEFGGKGALAFDGGCEHAGVMFLDGGLQRHLLVFGALPGLALQHVARADKGNSTDDAARFAVALGQDNDLLGGVEVCRGDDGGAQMGEEFAAFAQRGRRIVVAAEHQQRYAGLVQLANQLVVQLAGVAGRGAGVEDVAGDQHGIHRLGFHLFEQPGDQRLMLGLPALAHEVLAKVPVGGVEDTHWGK